MVSKEEEKNWWKLFRISCHWRLQWHDFLLFSTRFSYIGSRFTWTNNRIEGTIFSRLDKGLVNHQWLDLSPKSSISHLYKTWLDHSPVLLSIKSIPKPFKFQSMWCIQTNVHQIIEEPWKSEIHAPHMVKFSLKLKLLKTKLKIWNKEYFKNIFQSFKDLEDKVMIKEHSF